MQIVGIESATPEAGEVHTIDVWYSTRRGVWIVERLNADGAHVGNAHVCATHEDAQACLAEWLRTHGETHLVGSQAAARRKSMRRAA